MIEVREKSCRAPAIRGGFCRLRIDVYYSSPDDAVSHLRGFLAEVESGRWDKQGRKIVVMDGSARRYGELEYRGLG